MLDILALTLGWKTECGGNIPNLPFLLLFISRFQPVGVGVGIIRVLIT